MLQILKSSNSLGLSRQHTSTGIVSAFSPRLRKIPRPRSVRFKSVGDMNDCSMNPRRASPHGRSKSMLSGTFCISTGHGPEVPVVAVHLYALHEPAVRKAALRRLYNIPVLQVAVIPKREDYFAAPPL